MSFASLGGGLLAGASRWALPAAIVLAVATVVRLGLTANAAGWAVVQLLLVAVAACDLATRRIPNALTASGALLAVCARAAFERGALTEVVVAGAACLLAFGVFSLAVRGGLGMGDVKLAGLLGCLRGAAVVPALLIGTLAGSFAAIVLLAARRATARSSIAYGPYLAFGAAVAILGFHPPPIL